MGPGSVGQSEVQTEPNYWLKIPVGNKTKANRYHKWTCHHLAEERSRNSTTLEWADPIVPCKFCSWKQNPNPPHSQEEWGGVREQLWGVLVWISLWLKQQSQPNSNSHSPLDTSVGSSSGRATAAPQQPQEPQQRGTNFSVGKEKQQTHFSSSGWSRGSSETVFLELNVYLNMQMTLFHCYKVNIRFQMEALLFGWILSPETNGQHQNLLHWQWNHNTEMPPRARDQCSNTHTHTYTNKKVLDVIMLK